MDNLQDLSEGSIFKFVLLFYDDASRHKRKIQRISFFIENEWKLINSCMVEMFKLHLNYNQIVMRKLE